MPPVLKETVEFRGFVGMNCYQVSLFGGVFAQVVEFEVAILKKLHQLPIPLADNSHRRGSPGSLSCPQITRKMPENRPVGKTPPIC